MKLPLPIRVYADFECINHPQNNPKPTALCVIPNVPLKHIPIAVGYYVISPFGNKYYSYFGKGCVKWFVKEMLALEKKCN